MEKRRLSRLFKRGRSESAPRFGNENLKIVAGLGNPEDKYRNTRHNVGFETVNKLAFDFNISIKKYNRKIRAYSGEGKVGSAETLLMKPQTYMNLSGESVGAALRFYKLPPSALIVVCDDTNLPAGEVRVRAKGRAGGHNGLKSLIEHLGTDEFIRVRIGVGEKPQGWDLADYVLSRFTESERKTMIDAVTRAGEAVVTVLKEGVEAAMNRFNKKLKDAEGPDI